MKFFKHILATTDLSPESFAAVAYAGQLAKTDGSKLTVLHVPHSTSLVYTEFSPPIDMVGIDLAIQDAARKQLENWCRKNLRGLKSSIVLRGGVTHEVICQVAREIGAGLIIMATHGRKGLGHIVLGSVTESVLRDAPCPVLAVKPQTIGRGRKAGRTKKATRA